MPALEPTSHDRIEVLYRHHQGWLFNWLRGRLGCSHRAADLVQDTFARVLTARLPDELLAPRAYLTTVARHLVTDHWRRQELERAYFEALAVLPESESPSPERCLEVLQSLQRIDAALQALPPATREIFLMSQLDGCSYTHIAGARSVSLSTVKRHMTAAFLACLSAA